MPLPFEQGMQYFTERYLQLFGRAEADQHYIKGDNDKQFFIFSLEDDMKDGRGRLAQRLTAPQTSFFAKLHTDALTLCWRAASLQQKHHPALSDIFLMAWLFLSELPLGSQFHFLIYKV